MNRNEKAVAYLCANGFESAGVGVKDTTAVYISVWNDDLQFTQEFRLHDKEIEFLANQYDNERQ